MAEPIPFDARERRAEAERLALRLVEALAGDKRQLAEFFRETGLDPEGLRTVSRRPLFALGMLDYAVRYEDRAAWFCAVLGVERPDLEAARRVLAPEPATKVTAEDLRPRGRIEMPPLPPRRLYR